MIEHIKTVTLWSLIITSVILTWLIWTYEPEYEILQSTENYIESTEIGKEKTLSSIILPSQIIIHEGEERFWIHPMNGAYEELMEEFQNIEAGEFYQSFSRIPSAERQYEGLEFIFPDKLHHSWIPRLFNIEENAFPEDKIERMMIFVNYESPDAEVSIRFISFESEKIYQADTGLSTNQLTDLYKQFEDALTSVAPIQLETNQGDMFKKVHYVPNETATLKRSFLPIEELDPELFKQALFSDPEFVKHYFQGNREESFTDGNRMMNIVENRQLLKYIHPVIGTTTSDSERNVVETSVDFINNHLGWTDDYVLDSWHDLTMNDEVLYRMHINGLPIIDSNHNSSHYYTIQVTTVGNQITEYVRPLFHFSEGDLQWETDFYLPSYDQLLNILEDNEAIRLEWIEDIKIGHYMEEQPSYVSFEPSWFVKERGRWKRVELRNDQFIEFREGEVD